MGGRAARQGPPGRRRGGADQPGPGPGDPSRAGQTRLTGPSRGDSALLPVWPRLRRVSRIGTPSASHDEVSVRMRLFSNVPLILLLVVTWPLVLLGLVVACEWLERRTFAPKAPGP